MRKRKAYICFGFLLVNLYIVVIPTSAIGNHAPISCRECHENAQKMREMGFSHLVVSEQEVELQSRMATKCPDCHLGYPACGNNARTRQNMENLQPHAEKVQEGETDERKFPVKVDSPSPLRKYLVKNRSMSAIAPTVGSFPNRDTQRTHLSRDSRASGKICGMCHRS
jgi:hypothetical protein